MPTRPIMILARYNKRVKGRMERGSVAFAELIYHSLVCGRGGVMKQLLGQYDTPRSCYRLTFSRDISGAYADMSI